MFKHIFSRRRRPQPRDRTVLVDRRGPAPMPRIRYYD
jgi:hypothetical protein